MDGRDGWLGTGGVGSNLFSPTTKYEIEARTAKTHGNQ